MHTGPGCVDAVVVQCPVLVDDGVPYDSAAVAALGVEVCEADVAPPDGPHDPDRLATALASLGTDRMNFRT